MKTKFILLALSVSGFAFAGGAGNVAVKGGVTEKGKAATGVTAEFSPETGVNGRLEAIGNDISHGKSGRVNLDLKTRPFYLLSGGKGSFNGGHTSDLQYRPLKASGQLEMNGSKVGNSHAYAQTGLEYAVGKSRMGKHDVGGKGFNVAVSAVGGVRHDGGLEKSSMVVGPKASLDADFVNTKILGSGISANGGFAYIHNLVDNEVGGILQAQGEVRYNFYSRGTQAPVFVGAEARAEHVFYKNLVSGNKGTPNSMFGGVKAGASFY